jgi:tripartite-type tricarboxylate transporter receptor subunit TctC
MDRRQVIVASFASTAALAVPKVFASSYPDRAIRLIVPFAPGGGNDAVARIVMRRVGEQLGQPIVIENKPGAGSIVAFSEVTHSKPDGYLLTLGSPHVYILSSIYGKLPFNPLDDLVSVAALASVPNVLISSNASGISSMQELLAYAKSHPETPLAYGTAGVATPPHIAAVQLASMTNIRLVHAPYRGTALALQDVIAGHIPLAMVGLSNAMPFMNKKQIKILGIGSLQRSPLAPEVPTFDEQGIKGYDDIYWYDVLIRKGVDSSIMDRLHEEITKALRNPDVRKSLMDAGFEPLVWSRAENQIQLKRVGEKWLGLVQTYGIKVE